MIPGLNKTFEQFLEDVDGYKVNIRFEHEKYRRGVEKAAEESKKYKDEAGELASRKAKLAATCRDNVAGYDRELADQVKSYYLPQIRKYLGEYLCKPPKPDTLATLRAYSDFGIPMSRAELDGLILAAAGNFITLKAIAKVAEKSGFKVDFPGAEQYDKVVSSLNRMVEAPLLWCDLDYVHEATETYGDQITRRKDGSHYVSHGYRPDSMYCMLNAQSFDSVVNGIAEAKETWGAAFVPEISSLSPKKDEVTGDTISVQDQHLAERKTAAETVAITENTAVQIAERIGEQHRKAVRESKKILEAYGAK